VITSSLLSIPITNNAALFGGQPALSSLPRKRSLVVLPHYLIYLQIEEGLLGYPSCLYLPLPHFKDNNSLLCFCFSRLKCKTCALIRRHSFPVAITVIACSKSRQTSYTTTSISLQSTVHVQSSSLRLISTTQVEGFLRFPLALEQTMCPA